MSHAAQSVMPMVDHLEELRRRLFWSLGAVALATAAALGVVFTFPVIRVLELPIRPYLPTHKLAFTHPTDPFDVAMHTSIAFGVVAALPILLHQAWGFVRPGSNANRKIVTTTGVHVTTARHNARTREARSPRRLTSIAPNGRNVKPLPVISDPF